MMAAYTDDDLVYVDPAKRTVVAKVTFDSNGKPEELEMVIEDKKGAEKDAPKKKKPRKRYYPWGTYRTMKKQYRIEGKEKEIENYKKLDDAIKLAVEEPFWD